MIDRYPLWNAYWEDKRPKLWKINVPMYATASYSTGLHTEGSLRGYFLSSSTEKWYALIKTIFESLFHLTNISQAAHLLDPRMA